MKFNSDSTKSKVDKGYVSVDLAYFQCGRLRELVTNHGIKPIDDGDFHVTIAYDKELIDNTLEIDIDKNRLYEAKVIGVELMGEVKDGLQSAVALTLESEELVEEHFKWMAAGYEHGWPEYIPHMSVAYDVPVKDSERLVKALEPYIGRTFYFVNLSAEPVNNN
ncbi:RNA ligase [Vibrio phage Aphrodite1]|uniref:Anti-CBASS protein Acb1 n=1 Tax=Vibrio phage Aphrodite1 TaxID=2070057 RepID=A0A2I7QI25_9CAUD|nr:RNA ligase [Vibrio phage Aphrodite1]AUR81047.1 hypothetical protein Aphrodite1_0036 [Vibrio phage Aphrodite1]